MQKKLQFIQMLTAT